MLASAVENVLVTESLVNFKILKFSQNHGIVAPLSGTSLPDREKIQLEKTLFFSNLLPKRQIHICYSVRPSQSTQT